jgi:hypothetical protein
MLPYGGTPSVTRVSGVPYDRQYQWWEPQNDQARHGER